MRNAIVERSPIGKLRNFPGDPGGECDARHIHGAFSRARVSLHCSAWRSCRPVWHNVSLKECL
jgi:hypothetical protein